MKPKITDTYFDELDKATKETSSPAPVASTEEIMSFTVRIPKSVFEGLHDLAYSQRRSLGRRVTLSELATGALRDLLSKHQPQTTTETENQE